MQHTRRRRGARNQTKPIVKPDWMKKKTFGFCVLLFVALIGNVERRVRRPKGGLRNGPTEMQICHSTQICARQRPRLLVFGQRDSNVVVAAWMETRGKRGGNRGGIEGIGVYCEPNSRHCSIVPLFLFFTRQLEVHVLNIDGKAIEDE